MERREENTWEEKRFRLIFKKNIIVKIKLERVTT